MPVTLQLAMESAKLKHLTIGQAAAHLGLPPAGGARSLWAMVNCNLCAHINTVPALEAVERSIQCPACGSMMDVRERIVVEASKRTDIPAEFLSILLATSRVRPAPADLTEVAARVPFAVFRRRASEGIIDTL